MPQCHSVSVDNDRGYAENAAILLVVMLTIDHAAVPSDVMPRMQLHRQSKLEEVLLNFL